MASSGFIRYFFAKPDAAKDPAMFHMELFHEKEDLSDIDQLEKIKNCDGFLEGCQFDSPEARFFTWLAQHCARDYLRVDGCNTETLEWICSLFNVDASYLFAKLDAIKAERQLSRRIM